MLHLILCPCAGFSLAAIVDLHFFKYKGQLFCKLFWICLNRKGGYQYLFEANKQGRWASPVISFKLDLEPIPNCSRQCPLSLWQIW